MTVLSITILKEKQLRRGGSDVELSCPSVQPTAALNPPQVPLFPPMSISRLGWLKSSTTGSSSKRSGSSTPRALASSVTSFSTQSTSTTAYKDDKNRVAAYEVSTADLRLFMRLARGRSTPRKASETAGGGKEEEG